MELDKEALDRHITGNYGENQFKDMNIQSIREHVQLVIDDAKQSSTERTSAGMHISGTDHLGYLYAQIQGLGR